MAKILVIEDENRMAELLKRGLEESGHTVGTATNVSEGLRMFAYEKQVLDLLPKKIDNSRIKTSYVSQTRILFKF